MRQNLEKQAYFLSRQYQRRLLENPWSLKVQISIAEELRSSLQISDIRDVVELEARPSELQLHPILNAESEANKSGEEQ